MPIDHEIKPGECISSLAFEHGFFPGTIWDHPANAALKAERKDLNVLHPGDRVVIPDKREKQVPCATAQRHRFRRRGVPQLFRVQLLRVGKPVADRDYTLDVDGHLCRGKTDGEGWLSHYIEPSAREAVITVARGRVYRIKLGHLEPIDEIAGIQSRLVNLGHYTGPVDNRLDEATKTAIRAYQTLRGFEPTGAVDEALKASLVKAVGS